MIEGMLGRVPVGDSQPVRLMGIINLSRESFYQGSVAGPEEALTLATAMKEQGADVIDLGAVSTAPGSPQISEAVERKRLFSALREILDCLDITVSVDTQRAAIADEALKIGAGCINDVSGLSDPKMARCVADHDGSLIIMAAKERPGDLLQLSEIIPRLGSLAREAEAAGVCPAKISIDPGIGKWIPEKTPEHDLAILDGMRRLRVLERPVMAAISRKSFIGARLRQPDPFERLGGSLAATAIAVYLGAHIVRTHDVSMSRDTIIMAEAIRGGPAISRDEELLIEVLGHTGHGLDLSEALLRSGVDERGFSALCRKGAFRILRASGCSSMEAIIIKQEMLARGGDAAIPKLALRSDPAPEDVLIFGTVGQISGLVRNLRGQPFRLAHIGAMIEKALGMMECPKRYR